MNIWLNTTKKEGTALVEDLMKGQSKYIFGNAIKYGDDYLHRAYVFKNGAEVHVEESHYSIRW